LKDQHITKYTKTQQISNKQCTSLGSSVSPPGSPWQNPKFG